MKYEVLLTEIRSLLLEIKADDPDTAVRQAKWKAQQEQLFDSRIGAMLVANVKKIEDADNS